MFNIWAYLGRYQGFKQFFTTVMILFSPLVMAQIFLPKLVERNPSSYIPDDDVIIRPMSNEVSFYQQYVASDNSSDVVKSRNQLKVWSDNQQFADQYGMDSSLAGSAYFVPNQDVKLEYFKDKYMRYLRQRGEQPLRDVPKIWYQDYRASNEVDTIDEMETRFKKSHHKSKNGDSGLSQVFQEQEVSLWKKTHFIFQPRLDQGLVVVGVKGPIAYARAWVGVNGKTEINFQKEIESIGFRFMFNYYAHSGEYFTSIDQRLVEHVYTRVTSLKKPSQTIQDDSVMLLYTRQF